MNNQTWEWSSFPPLTSKLFSEQQSCCFSLFSAMSKKVLLFPSELHFYGAISFIRNSEKSLCFYIQLSPENRIIKKSQTNILQKQSLKILTLRGNPIEDIWTELDLNFLIL